jgi:hypothetical protein
MTVVVVAATLAWAPGIGSLVGAFVGLLLVLAAFQVGLLLGAILFGLRVTHVIIGIGGELGQWTTTKRRIVLRNIPILATIGIAGERSPVRRRTVAAGASAAVVGVATAAATWLTTTTDFGKGLALAATATAIHELIPIRKAGGTTMGWFVFGLPKLKGRELAEMESTPRITKAKDAYHAGDLTTAEQIADELETEHPELLTVIGLRITTLAARARYAEALKLATSLTTRQDLSQREIAYIMATTAGLTALATEADQLPKELGIPTAKRTISGAIEIGYPKYRATGTLALIALLDGDADTAIQLGNQATESSEHVVGRADGLTTVAKAHMVAGNNAKARELVENAHELAGWHPRVAATRARLSIN